MSTEDVKRFAHAVNNASELRERIAGADATTAAWVKAGRDAGFQFTAEEFTSVVEARLGRKLATGDAVRELSATLGSAELSPEALDEVRGGQGKDPPPPPPPPPHPIIGIIAILIG